MNQKVIALFLAGLMVLSILPFLFSGGTKQSASDTIEVQSFSSIGGEQINIPLNSLSDGIVGTPSGAVVVQYLNVEEIENSHIQFVVGNTSTLDTLYGSNVETTYSATYDEDTWVEFHKISPEVIAFPYYISPEPYKEHQILLRENGLYTTVGTPMIIGTKDSIESVIDVLAGDNETSNDFNEILEYSVEGAQFEIARVSEEGADQVYMAIKTEDAVNYSLTTLYLNPVESTVANITASAENESVLEYEINNYGNITEVIVTTDSAGFFNLPFEPVM